MTLIMLQIKLRPDCLSSHLIQMEIGVIQPSSHAWNTVIDGYNVFSKMRQGKKEKLLPYM